MEQLKLCESEYHFASIVWEYEPLGSGELVKLCEQTLGWKKSTTYTVLKKLCQRGILKNDNSIVTSLINQQQIQKFKSQQFINQTFNGSLPQFITAFMNDKKLSKQEAEELKKLIDSYEEE
ncbi:BlaI/MecI/CopY family transcriptional regulator [Clostridium sp. WILCCON 0269]|uniref:BlaI/MecI/CopY family transcriptional regulator n=1 Tax=Candidatus Clostridium eludens TaxID=3381663 RepID=A0ABW8SFC2_9CLOT